MGIDRVGGQRFGMRRQTLEPGVLVGRKHREHAAGEREHFLLLEDDLVLVGVEFAVAPGQLFCHFEVARNGRRLIVAAGMHGTDAKFFRQGNDFIARAAVAHDQVASKATQFGVQLGQADMDETQTPVILWQLIEDIGVVDKHAIHLLR